MDALFISNMFKASWLYILTSRTSRGTEKGSTLDIK